MLSMILAFVELSSTMSATQCTMAPVGTHMYADLSCGRLEMSHAPLYVNMSQVPSGRMYSITILVQFHLFHRYNYTSRWNEYHLDAGYM